GAVYAFGQAAQFGGATPAAGSAAVDLEPTPSGRGYWIVTDKGAVTTRGDAAPFGAPGPGSLAKGETVTSLSATPTGHRHLIFAFDAPFRGSMGGTKLNKPVTGMVRFADGYLMVGEDGGIFDFSSKPFLGSLGNNPPAHPIVSVAALG